jgi:ribosomal silencing factor RsfS
MTLVSSQRCLCKKRGEKSALVGGRQKEKWNLFDLEDLVVMSK